MQQQQAEGGAKSAALVLELAALRDEAEMCRIAMATAQAENEELMGQLGSVGAQGGADPVLLKQVTEELVEITAG